MNCSPSGSCVHGILQARILECVAISFSRASSRPRDRTRISCLVCLADLFLTTEPPSVQFNSVTQSNSTLWIPWTQAHQASLSITNPHELKLMLIESVIPSSHLILCRLLLLLPPIPPSIRVFSKESELGKQYYPLRKDNIYTTGMVKQTFLSLYRCTLYIKEGPVRQGLCYVQIFLCSLKNLNSIPS